ncbi:hypothetical protein ACOJBO_00415 [Rhizobium beringeri]
MTVYNIALIGFGGVNRALCRIDRFENQLWERDLGFRLNIVAVSDLYLWVCHIPKRPGRKDPR